MIQINPINYLIVIAAVGIETALIIWVLIICSKKE